MQHLHMFISIAMVISLITNFIQYILRKRCEEGSEEYVRISKREKISSRILILLVVINFLLHLIYGSLYKI